MKLKDGARKCPKCKCIYSSKVDRCPYCMEREAKKLMKKLK